MFEAVTRCKMHCQKNPWKIPHWGNIFKIIHFFFHFVLNAATLSLSHSCFLLLSLTHVFPSPTHSYRDVATSFKDTETAVPMIWQNYKQRKRLDFSFIVTKTQKHEKAAWNQTCFLWNRKKLCTEIYFNPRGASDQVLNNFLIESGMWLQTREVHSSMVVSSSLML